MPSWNRRDKGSYQAERNPSVLYGTSVSAAIMHVYIVATDT